MKKILFLSSAFLMTMAGAHAADKIITNANTCTVDVLGVADNNATANTIATWSLIDYECPAGQYLLNSDGTLKCTECPVGSYCPGGKYTVESENNGANTCPADYTSDAGAVGENECYMGCELACTQQTCPEHSENCTHGEFKTTGKQYINATCNAYPSICPITDFGCDTGYTKTEQTTGSIYLDKYCTISCSMDNVDEVNGTNSNIIDGIDNGINDCDIIKPGTMITNGILYEVSYNNYSPDSVGTQEYVLSNGNTIKYLSNADFSTTSTGNYIWVRMAYTEAISETPELMLFMSDFEKYGTISQSTMSYFETRLSAQDFKIMNIIKNMLDTGNLSSCVDYLGFVPLLQNVQLSQTWIYIDNINDDYAFDTKSVYFPVVEFIKKIDISSENDELIKELRTGEYCAHNTININWNPDNGNSTIENMCLYDGGIDIPDDPVKPGYTFTGWKLVE